MTRGGNVSRKPRKQSATGFYHITNRGVNKAKVFLDSEDHRFFITCIDLARRVCDFQIIAYCIMTNHFHLIVRCDECLPIPSSMFQSIGARFCAYYHRKYKTAGQVFQGRFHSETIETDSHLLSAIRYVWNNPVDAGICKTADAYAWSSYNILPNASTLVDNRFLRGLMSVEEWREFVLQRNSDLHLEPFSIRNDDVHARSVIRRICGNSKLRVMSRGTVSNPGFGDACAYVIERCRRYEVPIAQVASMTEISPSTIYRHMRRKRTDGQNPVAANRSP